MHGKEGKRRDGIRSVEIGLGWGESMMSCSISGMSDELVISLFGSIVLGLIIPEMEKSFELTKWCLYVRGSSLHSVTSTFGS